MASDPAVEEKIGMGLMGSPYQRVPYIWVDG